MIDDKYKPDLSNNDNGSTASLYEARSFFFNGTLPEVVRNSAKIPFSNFYKEHFFYGILDNDGDVIAPKITGNSFENLEIVGYLGQEPLYLQDFVAESLNDLKKELKNLLINCFDDNEAAAMRASPYFNFRVEDAFRKSISIDASNQSKAELLSAIFREDIKKNNKINSKIDNIKNFIVYFTNFIVSNNLGPVTTSRQQCDNSLTFFNNSISFRIAKDDASNDENKFDKFYNDIAFDQFSKSCIKFGFMIDKNIPFILTADLSSPFMKKYWSPLYNDVNQIFSERFYKIYKSDLISLKMFFWIAYQQFIQTNFYTPKDLNNSCIGDLLKAVPDRDISRRKNYANSFTDFYTELPDKFWLNLYVYFKIVDMNLDFSELEYYSLVKQSYEYLNIKNKTTEISMEFINNKFDETKNQPYFDSLRMKKTMLQEDDQEPSADLSKQKLIFRG